MTKLEFLDKINDILVGLNTLESDLLGSLYDELMRDAGWHPASDLPIVPKDEDSVWVYCLVYGKGTDGSVLVPMCVEFTKLLTLGWILNENIIVKWWCYPPKEE